MAAKEFKLTAERLAELEQELNWLKTVREKEVAELIKEARSFGDLSENSEYDEAKNEQSKLYGRIAEVENILADFRNRDIPVAVINEHLQGDLVKFYGVHGTDFFYWFYPSPCSHSKFGLEKINGIAKGIPFSVEELKIQSDKAAEALNVPIYGGDCVVSADGTLRIIDFNDWPSFARCREEAGGKIAECIYNRAKKQMKQ